jgi:glycolate oxidase FAD binding subunit
MTDDLAKQLADLLPETEDLIPWDNCDRWLKNKVEAAISPTNPSIITNPPLYWVAPPDANTLSKVLQIANSQRQAILPLGNGSKLHWGSLVHSPQLIVTTQKLNRWVDHALGDLTATVEAGMTLQTLQSDLARHNQYLPLNPAYASNATLGGIVATADAGSWRQRYGGVRDLVLGISFVRADGAIAKAGGRVVKNVAGYDLMKLFTGSYGTLGILTEITFRLYPLPETAQTIVIAGNEDNLAHFTQDFRKTGLSPTAAEFMAPALTQILALGKQSSILIRFENLTATVTAQIAQTQALARSLNLTSQVLYAEDEANLWQRWQNRITDSPTAGEILAKIGVRPQQIPDYLQQLALLCPQTGIASFNLGSGVGKLRVAEELGILTKLRSQAQLADGYLTLLEASPAAKQAIEPWGYQGNALELMQKIKQKFDPNHILSPGRFCRD